MQRNDRVHITDGPLKGRDGRLLKRRAFGGKWVVLVGRERHVIKEEDLYRLAPESTACPACHAPDVRTHINEDGVSGSWSWQGGAGRVTVEWDEKVAVVDIPGVGSQQLRHDDPAYLALESLILG